MSAGERLIAALDALSIGCAENATAKDVEFATAALDALDADTWPPDTLPAEWS